MWPIILEEVVKRVGQALLVYAQEKAVETAVSIGEHWVSALSNWASQKLTSQTLDEWRNNNAQYRENLEGTLFLYHDSSTETEEGALYRVLRTKLFGSPLGASLIKQWESEILRTSQAGRPQREWEIRFADIPLSMSIIQWATAMALKYNSTVRDIIKERQGARVSSG